MLIGRIKRVLQQRHIHLLHAPENALHFPLPHSSSSICSLPLNKPAPDIYHDDEFHPGVGLETVASEPLVDGVQETVVPWERPAGGEGGGGAGGEYVERGGEKEGELQRGAQGHVMRLGGEDGDVQRVVLLRC